MRRFHWPFNGRRYIGNKNTMEVHDLDNEQIACQIDDIDPQYIVTFGPDSLETAHDEGFDNCVHCIGKPHQ